jgi:hypothetical protein
MPTVTLPRTQYSQPAVREVAIALGMRVVTTSGRKSVCTLTGTEEQLFEFCGIMDSLAFFSRKATYTRISNKAADKVVL